MSLFLSLPRQRCAPWACLLVAGSCGLLLGCRQTAQRANSPTPIEVPQFHGPASGPELLPLPAGPAVPPMPPALDDGVPPLPGTAGRAGKARNSGDGLEHVGGFTPAPHFTDVPALSVPSQMDEISLPPIQRIGGDADGFAATDDAVEVTPLPRPKLVLKDVSKAPVSLDASLFILELHDTEAYAAELPTLIEMSDTPGIPLPAPLSERTGLPQVSAREIPLPGVPHLPAWPEGGLPQNIVVSPGPSAPKWSAADDLPSPRRLAIDNSDWDLRPIQ